MKIQTNVKAGLDFTASVKTSTDVSVKTSSDVTISFKS